MKKQIGYKFNHLQIANSFLEHHKDYFDVFLKAIKFYGYYDEFAKKPSFAKKVETLLSNPMYQEISNNDLIYEIFPEIK